MMVLKKKTSPFPGGLFSGEPLLNLRGFKSHTVDGSEIRRENQLRLLFTGF